MDNSEKVLGALCGTQLTIGTIALAIAGGPLWAVLAFGSLAAGGLFMAVAGE